MKDGYIVRLKYFSPYRKSLVVSFRMDSRWQMAGITAGDLPERKVFLFRFRLQLQMVCPPHVSRTITHRFAKNAYAVIDHNFRGIAVLLLLTAIMGLLKKSASCVLAIFPWSGTPCTLRAQKWLWPCWTNFFEQTRDLWPSKSPWGFLPMENSIIQHSHYWSAGGGLTPAIDRRPYCGRNHEWSGWLQLIAPRKESRQVTTKSIGMSRMDENKVRVQGIPTYSKFEKHNTSRVTFLRGISFLL